ncbi:MAG: DUF4199 domain-containing protein [Bacteroidia bacterium]|nr:DUF4199 domain-containing protein [Bacteroidia bacterium]MCZ2248864.1 DUF4199 domain-containing protein [Bacteroidia bacterium]
MKVNKTKHGLITGLFCGVWILGADLLKLNDALGRYLILSCLIFIFGGIFWAIFDTRRSIGGEIEFKEALKTGISTGVLSAIIFSGVLFIHYKYMVPDFADAIMIEVKEKLINSGKSGEELEQALAMFRQDFTPTGQAGKTLLVSIFLSLFFAAINALILCKKD